ncbi:unnamed protein product [Bursaphelenchus xylophilus]|uniref:(pine wood nematode) hypothetical protein n=1 Tax=Bursaphelenchus xylophilus TaxID=6326 RepID=A0A1I7RL27_BURXY|nr:unnamed protein product [Bursaphelenchus xylophilus]CAG9083540.1 unnamed protein product [Bursaphelenchus xylophilus]
MGPKSDSVVSKEMKDKDFDTEVDSDRRKPETGRDVPRQLIRIQKTKVGDGIVKVELRYVSYQKNDKNDLKEGDVSSQILAHLFAKYQEMESGTKKKIFIDQQPQYIKSLLLKMENADSLNK